MMIDSNILIYSLNDSSPHFKQAQSFLRAQKSVIISHQNILETLRVITHPTRFPNPFTHKQAIRAIEAILSNSQILHPKSSTYLLALELIKKYQIIGNQIFDAYLVATALDNGVTMIASDNIKHLGKYTEIKVINPFA